MSNTNPIFVDTANISWVDLGSTIFVTVVNTGTGSTSFDGTTNSNLVFSSSSPNGSFLQKIVAQAGGTNAVSVARVFINNGGSIATADNNALYTQFSLPATTASNTVATAHIEIPINIKLPSGYKVYVSLGAAANLASGWAFIGIGGNY
jgi:hypothetical protein